MTFIYQANEKGLQQIKEILQARHNQFINEEPTTANLNAWAADAENFIENDGNWDGSPSIEITARDSVSGHTELHSLNMDGFDKITLED